MAGIRRADKRGGFRAAARESTKAALYPICSPFAICAFIPWQHLRPLL